VQDIKFGEFSELESQSSESEPQPIDQKINIQEIEKMAGAE